MSFLQPLGLALAALAVVPILLHLLRRETVQRLAFPALRYLRSAERRTARSLRVRDFLLLAVRIGLLVLLALAAAGPLAGRGGVEDHAPTDAVLLIDNSASAGRVAGGRTLLDRQLDLARTSLDLASHADRFWVVPAGSPPLAAGVDAATARRMLDSVPASDAAVDLPDAVGQATAAVPVTDGRARELQIYTDLQATGLRGEGPDLTGWGRVAVAAVTADAGRNDFVADLRLQPEGAVVPGEPGFAVVRVDAAGTEARGDSVEIRLLVDGSTVAMGRAAPGSEAIIPLPELRAGSHALQAVIAPSGLRADDARRLGIVVAEPPAVRFVGGSEDFLRSAIETLAADGRLRAEGDELIHVIEGTDGDLRPGGRALILVPPAEMTRLPAFQQRLDALRIPWQVRAHPGAGELRLEAPSDLPSLADVRIEQSYSLERRTAPSTADDAVLLRTTDGAPWLVRGRTGERVYLLLGSPLHPDATSLPVSAAMMPFVERLLLRWSRPAAAPIGSVDVGDTVTLPPRIEAIRAPGGTRRPAEGGAPWTPVRAGSWTWLLPGPGGLAERHVGANVPRSESDPRRAGDDDLRRTLAGAEVTVAHGAARWPDAVFGARRGAEATPWIVAAALALVLLELFLAAPRGGRETSRADGAPARPAGPSVTRTAST